MGRAPCCDKSKVKKGPWSPEEDAKLKDFMDKNGTGGNWIALPQKAGLKRCGKSCRLRWLNYLRPNIKHGEFTEDEDRVICSLYSTIGSRWSIIAAQLPGRTDNDIKNYWNTKLKKKLMATMLISPSSSSAPPSSYYSSRSHRPSVISPTPPSLSSPSPMFSSASGSVPNFPTQPPPLSFSGLESLSLHSPNFMYNFQMSQQDHQSFVNPIMMQQYHHQQQATVLNTKGNSNVLMFGGSEVSGSSSDGSCSQISYDRSSSRVDQDRQFLGKYCFQGSFNGDDDNNNNNNQQIHQGHNNNIINNNRFFLDYGNQGQFGNNTTTTVASPAVTAATPHQQMQYDLEVVRELVSSGSSNGRHNNNNDFSFFNYENKTDEKGMMYFY